MTPKGEEGEDAGSPGGSLRPSDATFVYTSDANRTRGSFTITDTVIIIEEKDIRCRRDDSLFEETVGRRDWRRVKKKKKEITSTRRKEKLSRRGGSVLGKEAWRKRKRRSEGRGRAP